MKRIDWPMKYLFAALWLTACAGAGSEGNFGNKKEDFNQKILAAISLMPQGGGYDASDTTKNLLVKAVGLASGELKVDARAARPSFCSGATYLVLLKALETGDKALLPVPNQKDGHGIFGRWNANGPGAAKLVADLDCGRNFVDWKAARPGDFLKIWWTNEIGAREHGHLVIYLGHDETSLRFWSSNQPGGYGSKTIMRAQCQRVLFTRITDPEKFAGARSLSEVDQWLEDMLRKSFTWDGVKLRCEVQ